MFISILLLQVHRVTLLYYLLASVPALWCRCMTCAYLNCYVSHVFYSYSYMPIPVIYYSYHLLWLPVVVYYGYLQSTLATYSKTMAVCSVLWLPIVYYGSLQSAMATCSLLRLLAVCYGYLQSTMAIPSLPSVLSSLLYAATLLCQPSLYYNNLCAAQSALPAQLTYAIAFSTYTQLYTLSGLYMTMPTYSCYVSFVFNLAIPSLLSLPYHMS